MIPRMKMVLPTKGSERNLQVAKPRLFSAFYRNGTEPNAIRAFLGIDPSARTDGGSARQNQKRDRPDLEAVPFLARQEGFEPPAA